MTTQTPDWQALVDRPGLVERRTNRRRKIFGRVSAIAATAIAWLVVGALLFGCAVGRFTLLVHPETGDVRQCRAQGVGIVGVRLADQSWQACVREFQNLGYLKSEDLTPEQRNSSERAAELKRYWREELRPAVERGDVTAVEATERLNAREREYFQETPFLERLQHYRLALARLVDQGILTPLDAEQYEAEARLTRKFQEIPPERTAPRQAAPLF